MALIVTGMMAADWLQVAAIYREGIETGHATFAPQSPATWEEWCKNKIMACNLVAKANHEILGWAALTPISHRAVYAGVAEVSVYVGANARGKGVGSLLLHELIRTSEANGVWTLQAGIFPENQASLSLHFKHGFRQVGIRQKMGKMQFGPLQGRWRDVVLLERRSKVVGV
ncbi:MAG: GNAT family N-acetyltransferase [bacterium]